MSHRPDLEDHDADGVGHDVVQLPRDPRPFLGDGDPGRALPFALGPRGALLGGLRLLGPLVQGEPDQPADREEHRDEEQVADGVGRVVVDDGRRAGHHDGQPDPRLPLVTQVAQQHGGDHAGDGDRGLAHDQATVEEGQGGADQPGAAGTRTAPDDAAAGRGSSPRPPPPREPSWSRPGRCGSVRAERPGGAASARTTISASRPWSARRPRTRLTTPRTPRNRPGVLTK